MSAFEGWMLGYLVNALWQVPMVFAAAWMVARLVRRDSVEMERRVWVSALILEVLLPASSGGTGAWMLRVMSRWLGDGKASADGEVRVAVGDGVAVQGMLRLPASVQLSLLVVYGCVLVYFAGRLAWGLWKTAALKRKAKCVLLRGNAAQEWNRLVAAFDCEGVELGETPSIPGPVTVGWRRGMVLVPPGFLLRITKTEWDAVVAHELAHIVRGDFLKNLVYEFAKLPLVWHPAMWWTRARVAESREMVCDAMVTEACIGIDREGYARSLVRLASLLVNRTPERTLHAIGIFDANLFERRVMKLMDKRKQWTGARRVLTTVACVAVGVATCGSAWALRMEVAEPTAQTSANSGAARVSGGVMAGNNLMKVPPVYPPDAKDAKITGAVVLKAIIAKDGTIENLQVVSGPEKLRKSALDSVRQWTYKPYLLNGEPTEVETTVTVTYSLSK